ncbi:Rha family transcriptional regulator, partial [Herbiconiux daphne]
IAQLTGKRHGHVMDACRTMFEALGLTSTDFSVDVPYPIGNGAIATREVFELDKELTMTLVSGYNIRLRHAIVQRWLHLEAENVAQKVEIKNLRQQLRDNFTPMIEARKEQLAEEGNGFQPYHGGNEADLLNRLVFGCSAKKLKEFRGVDNVRDNATAEEIKALDFLERMNEMLIISGKNFQERKHSLTTMLQKKFPSFASQ